MTDKNRQRNQAIVQSRLEARNKSETRFRLFGLAMVGVAIIACFMLILSIFFQSLPALSENRLVLNLPLDAQKLDPKGTRNPQDIRSQGDFAGVVMDNLLLRFPNAEADGGYDVLSELVSTIAITPMAKQIADNPNLIGTTTPFSFALNSDLDVYLKGGFGRAREGQFRAANLNVISPSEIELQLSENQKLVYDGLSQASQPLRLDGQVPSLLLFANGGAFKVTQIANGRLSATQIIPPKTALAATNQAFKSASIKMPEDGRAIGDNMIAYGEILQAEGMVKARPNFTLLANADSNDPEMAGLLSAMVGSFLTLCVTFVITVPIGVMAAVYLEEFAPKNFWTDMVEVNINNLAAVPSIVFGLLGFSVFLHFFQMPRSAPLVGGIVLALMALPVVIIASRAAIKAVPPSIREAALVVGASKVQSVFHHVLPLATPGIMTGSILAMAHALGETAPLLMIGMVAFIADVPQSLVDSSTVLPVEIFMWAGRPERAWEAKTSAAIIVLLLFMIFINIIAIVVRRRFERRW